MSRKLDKSRGIVNSSSSESDCDKNSNLDVDRVCDKNDNGNIRKRKMSRAIKVQINAEDGNDDDDDEEKKNENILVDSISSAYGSNSSMDRNKIGQLTLNAQELGHPQEAYNPAEFQSVFNNNQTPVYVRRSRNKQYGNGANTVSFNVPIPHVPSIGGQSLFRYDLDQIPPKSTDAEKNKLTKGYLATVTALAYAIFIIIFSIVLFIGDAVQDQHPIPDLFCIFLIAVGFSYFLFLFIDIRFHVHKAKKAVEQRERRKSIFQAHVTNFDANADPAQLNIQLPDWNVEPLTAIPHKYCFVMGRHGELLYLKLGAAWFCFGLLIHSMLVLSYQVIFLTSTDPAYLRCASYATVTLEVLFPLYCLFLLFFVFKYANLIINEYRGLARLALMHAIGTSLAFWVHTIVRETSNAIRMKDHNKDKNETSHTFTPYLLECTGPEALNAIYKNFSPYLYPFVIEFCILMVGIFYMIYANINKCPKKLAAKHAHSSSSNSNLTTNSNEEMGSDFSEHVKNLVEHDSHYNSNLIVHADCHSANKGIFCGLILLVMTIVFAILYFVAVSDENYVEIGITMNALFELVVLVIMLAAVILAYFQTTKLDVNSLPVLSLDDILLYISLPAFFLDSIFSLVPAYYYGSAINISKIFMQLIQVLVQTPWIMDGLRRCANARTLRRDKPGRELVTFITIANVALWIFYTFSVKTVYIEDERYKYYGDFLWTILSHLSMPLIMFYRFHSSVCLVDIWRHAYEPGEPVH